MPGMTLDEGAPSLAPPAPAAPAEKKRHLTRGIVILMVLTLLAIVAPIVAVLLARHSPGSLGGTATVQITLLNDTSSTLVLQTCGLNCLPDVPSITIPASSSAQVPVAAGVVTRYYVRDGSGQPVGCLPLQFGAPGAVAASRAEGCPGKPIPGP